MFSRSKITLLNALRLVAAPVAIFYSWHMVASGLNVNRYLAPPNNILTSDKTSYFSALSTPAGIDALFALLLVLAQAVFFCVVAYQFVWRKRKLTERIILLALALIVTWVVTSFSLTGVSHSAYGDGLLSAKQEALIGFNNEARRLDQRMTGIYKQHIKSLNDWAQDEEDGVGFTEKKGCGHYCKNYKQEHWNQKETFTAVLGFISVPATLGLPTIENAEANLAALEEKLQYFKHWGEQSQVATSAVANRLTTLKIKVEAWRPKKDLTVSKESLALEYAQETLLAVITLSASVEQVLRVTVTLIPEMVLMMLSLAGTIQSRVQSLLDESQELEDETEAIERLSETLDKNAQSKQNHVSSIFNKRLQDKRLKTYKKVS